MGILKIRWNLAKASLKLNPSITRSAMKKSPSALLAVFVTILLVGAPLAYLLNSEKLETRDLSYENDRMNAELTMLRESSLTTEGEMLFYDLGTLDATATSKEVAFSDMFTVEGLKNITADCSETVEEGYFENLLTTFADVTGMQYSFTTDGVAPETYTVTVFPNTSNYKDLASFTNDFNACSVGGTWATRMNESKLMFKSSCSAAYGEEIPALTCADIQEKLVVEFN